MTAAAGPRRSILRQSFFSATFGNGTLMMRRHSGFGHGACLPASSTGRCNSSSHQLHLKSMVFGVPSSPAGTAGSSANAEAASASIFSGGSSIISGSGMPLLLAVSARLGVPLLFIFSGAGIVVAPGFAEAAGFFAAAGGVGLEAGAVVGDGAFGDGAAGTATTFWHTGHLIFLPARWSFTLSVFLHLSHLTRIGMMGFLKFTSRSRWPSVSLIELHEMGKSFFAPISRIRFALAVQKQLDCH